MSAAALPRSLLLPGFVRATRFFLSYEKRLFTTPAAGRSTGRTVALMGAVTGLRLPVE